MKDADHLLTLVRALAAELKPGVRDLSALGLNHRLERDFGLDSLARMELLLRIEREMGAPLGEAALVAETPADLLPLIGHAPRPNAPVTSAVPPAPTVGKFAAPPAEVATLTAVLDWHVRHQGERIHITLLGEDGREDPISYARLAAAARAVAAGLLRLGAPPGARIALMLPTGLDFFSAFYGALYAGCVPVPLYPPARPAQLEEHLRRIAGILANAGARWFITDPRARAFAQALSGKCPTLAGIITVAELPVAAATGPMPTLAADDLAFIQYTSGSTGDPKGVALTHANLLANIDALRLAARATPADRFVSWLPLYHDMGLIGAGMGSLVIGFPLVLMSPLAFLARPVRWLEAISRHRGTLSAAPNFAYEICANKLADSELAGLDLSCWRIACNGAEAVSPVTLERFAARMAPYGLRREALTPVYGLAECSVGLAFPPPGRGPRIDRVARRALADEGLVQPVSDDQPGAQAVPGCGHALPGHAIRIVDPAGRELAERRVGRIQFRGPSATSGYFENPAATAKLFDGDWLNTGDLGYLADGELFVTGREKDLIIRGGHNIHPQELEEAVGRIAGVRAGNVVVFPATDPRAGTERVVVLAETRGATELHTRIRAEVERLAVDLTGLPADEVVLAPPGTVLKTSSGKLRRAACRTAYERGELLRRRRSPQWQAFQLLLDAAFARLRSALRALASGVWGAWAYTVFALLAPTLWLLIALAPTLALRRAAARAGARWALAATGLGPRVAGLEHLTDNGPVVVVVNHASYLDGVVLTAALPTRFAYVAKQELLDHPLSATPLRRLNAAFVERFETARGVEDTQALEARVRAGDSLVFFAEGTFHDAPGLLPFRTGAFLVAARAGAPVVPVTLSGTRALLPGQRRWPRFSPLAVTIHPPLLPTGSDWQAALALRDPARTVILARLGEPDAGLRISIQPTVVPVMTTLNRILAATDFSDLGNAAVRRAALLAARENAELLIVHAFPRQSALEAAFGADDLPVRLRAAAKANMAALVETGRTVGAARLRAEIAEGSAYRAVADAAETFRPDLVVIGAHGKGALQQFFLGGTAARILSRAAGPVLVARRPAEQDYARALAAVDLGPRSGAVLRAALVVAARARVTMLHAYLAPFEAKLRYKRFPEKDILRYAETESHAAQRDMDALLADPELARLDIERRIVHGDPNPALPEAIRELDADLIVVGRHGGSRLGETVMGSVSRFLAYYAPCDVLIV